MKKKIKMEIKMKEKELYLREVITQERFGEKKVLEIFEGDIKKDKKYWKKYQNAKARYFELKEKKLSHKNNKSKVVGK